MSARKVANHIEIYEMDVRSGQTGVHLRYILIFSALLAAFGIGAAALFS